MKKWLFLFTFLLVASSANAGWYFAGGADPCATMGASGTYVLWWNGEYASDTDKACLNSGTSTADGTADAGVINTTNPIAGTTDALLDADGEDIRWTAGSAGLIDTGTIEVNIKTPADLTGVLTVVAEVLYSTAGSDNYIAIYHIEGAVYGRYRGAAASQTVTHAVTTLSTSTVYTVCYTWNDTSNIHGVRIDTGANSGCTGDGSWDTDSEALTSLAGTPDLIGIGEITSVLAQAGAVQVDDLKVREGYEVP